MKLVVRAPGLTSGEKVVDIKNTNASIANVRAVLAICLKLDAKSFRITHATADLDDDKTLLKNTSLAEGDVVTLVPKRERDAANDLEDNEAPRPSGSNTPSRQVSPTSKNASKKHVDPTAASDEASSPNEQRSTLDLKTLPRINYDEVHKLYTPLLNMGFTDIQVATALRKNGYNTDRAMKYLIEGIFNGNIELPPRKHSSKKKTVTQKGDEKKDAEGAVPAAVDGESDDDDDEEWEDIGSEDEQDEIDQERIELALGLFNLPDYETLRDRFLHNPQEAMVEIQNEDPNIFTLIGRHQQFFLDFVHEGPTPEFLGRYGITPEMVEDLDELGGMEDDLYFDEEGEFEEGDEEFEEGSDDDDFEEAEEDDIVDGDDDAPMDYGINLHGARGGGRFYGRARGAPGASSAAAQIMAEWGPADDENIATLMGLGFSRDQCRAAYIRAMKNMDRAAAILFEGGAPSM